VHAVKLTEFVRADRVVVPLDAGTLREAALALLDRLVATGAIANTERLAQRVTELRSEDVVAMGERAFLIHCRTDAVREMAVAIGVAPRDIVRELGAEEVQHARIALMIVAPPRMAARYLQVLGALARLLSRPQVVEQIVAAPDTQAIAALPAFGEVELPRQLAVGDIMTQRPRTVMPETPLRDAALQMARSGIAALPVVEENDVIVGMLAERDLLRHLLGSYLQGDTPPRPTPDGVNARRAVRDAMTRQVLCVSPEQPLAEVASLLINKDVEQVPVVREGRLVGFLTRGDIVRKLIGW
jgi:CBS domain-containing protein/mannitol/fructose-specific phosphotransferase system IIA component (Ntr-type)